MKFWEKIEPAQIRLERKEDDRVVYTFPIIPSKGPYQDMRIEYIVSFEKEEGLPALGLLWDFDDDIDWLPEDQVEVIEDAEDMGKTLDMWTVLFSAKIEAAMKNDWDDPIHFELLDLQDPESTIKIMRTIENTVTIFLEAHIHEVDAVTFSADMEDHGRISVYSRYSKMLQKQLGWKVLAAETPRRDNSYVFICYDEKLLKEP